MKITKSQLRQIIIEQIEEEHPYGKYYAKGFDDASAGAKRKKYHSVKKDSAGQLDWEVESIDKPNYDAGYVDGTDHHELVTGITRAVTGGLMPENTKRKSSMKISKSQLKQIIKEELQGVLQEDDQEDKRGQLIALLNQLPKNSVIKSLFTGASRMKSVQELEVIFLALQAGKTLDAAVASAVQGDENLAKLYKRRLSNEDMAGLAGVDIKTLAGLVKSLNFDEKGKLKRNRKRASRTAGVPKYSRAS